MAEFTRHDMAALLPHGGTARLLTEIVVVEPGRIVAVGRIPSNHPLAAGDRAPCFMALELGAQAAATWEAMQRRGQPGHERPRIGYLVGVRSSRFAAPDLPVETDITITAELAGAAAPLAVYRIAVAIDGVALASATLSTHSGAGGGTRE